MADDSKVQIEIVLDDGSVQKGFARIADKAGVATNKIKTDVYSIENAFSDLAPGASGVFNRISSFATSSIGKVALSVTAVSVALKEAFSLAQIGEETLKIQKSFDTLSNQVGVSGASLRASLDEAAGGAVDLEDVLKASSDAVMELGSRATVLPQILTIARQASNAFGVDTLQAFEAINSAILTGQTRSLKSVGIYIDANKAINDYKISIGATSRELTLVERQQAILNATLEKSGKIFKDISIDGDSLKTSLTRLKVGFGDFFENIGVAIYKSPLGAFFKNISKAAADALNTINLNMSASLGTGLDALRPKLELAKQDLEKYTETLNLANKTKMLYGLSLHRNSDAYESLVGKIASTKTTIASLTEEIKNSEGANKSSADAASASADVKVDSINKVTAAMLDNNTKFLVTSASSISVAETMSMSFSNMASTVSMSIVETAKTMKTTTGQMSSMLLNGFGNAAGSAFAAFGKALAKGENSLEAFAQSFLASMGQMAIQMGTMFIMQGLIATIAPGPAAGLGITNGPALIAAGAALAAFGGILSASNGGASTSAGGAGATGGGGIAATPETAPAQDIANQEPVRPGASISVVVQGDIFDSSETGLRLSQILSDAFTDNGVTVTGAV